MDSFEVVWLKFKKEGKYYFYLFVVFVKDNYDIFYFVFELFNC